ncbi:glycine betaine abc transporter substrate-binding protein [Leptolyngbya sp. Heron Island J]|uniref:glycine betaine ABC transporter substrate-binding protein n=1 Tax=Leptolyngbya sp. Heron Island J TaxID=1385935 RepID=UPI0003B9E66B|nr:glycine betaine ABC transporter substrate-binding protein [Leptolyngbya sp. Heron Island J]ESA37916.1 glycine betaine abc transporter substrate-binding protein [Leptolyngbya sp. Heron Island J]
MKTMIGAATTAIALLVPMAAYAAEATNIQLGQVGLSFYAVKGGVVQELLERDGYTVEVTEGSHAEIFPMLGEGDVDILAATWLPNGHAALYEPVQDVTFPIAPLYEDARFFWVVPSYVPEDEVNSIADLTDPDVRANFPDQITSLPEATGLTTGGRRVVEAYGLDEAGYELVAAPPADWLSTFEDAIAAGTWVVFPLWQPQWVNAAYDVRALEEPLNAYGDPDSAYLLGHKGLADKLSPESLERLSNVRLSVEDVTEMDRMVNVDGLTPREAARTWMDTNQETVESWGY